MTFANFTAAGSIPSSALGFNRNNGFSVSTDNFAGALTFENATPFYLETPHADKAAVFFDRDGAVSGAAGAYVVPNVPFMVSGGCTARPDWNAQVCPNRYVGLDVRSDAETVAPLTLVRDDALSLALVGVPNAPTRADASVIPGRGYMVQFSGRCRCTLGMRAGWAPTPRPSSCGARRSSTPAHPVGTAAQRARAS